MNRDEVFAARWRADREIHRAWGSYLACRIKEAIVPVIAPESIDYFLKSAVIPRLKAENKLIEKAFYRNKTYKDPYLDITDKVGIRFVVLLGSDITKVVGALTSIEGWTRSKDRDYEEEQKRNPVSFDYAAVHFVVRPESDLDVDGAKIPAGTPCEVQIKTILQHAYSELTHDTIYKPQIQATSVMQRDAAKAMALLEATNDYFEKVSEQVSAAISAVRDITLGLSSVYRDSTGLEPSPSLIEGLFLEAYEKLAVGDFPACVIDMLASRPFLIDRIKERVAKRNPIFAQPSILLAYLDIMQRGRGAMSNWPLTAEEMESLLNDFGESIH